MVLAGMAPAPSPGLTVGDLPCGPRAWLSDADATDSDRRFVLESQEFTICLHALGIGFLISSAPGSPATLLLLLLLLLRLELWGSRV